MKNNNNILYPLDASNGIVFKTSTSNNDRIKSELRMLLSTLPGERIFNPNYYLSIDDLLFEEYNDVSELNDVIKNRISSVVNNFIPNIAIQEIYTSTENHNINIRVIYTINEEESLNELIIKKEIYE